VEPLIEPSKNSLGSGLIFDFSAEPDEFYTEDMLPENLKEQI
jgi:hypothetical protein